MPTPKQLKKAAAAVAKAAKITAAERTAQAVALAGQIDALQLQHSGTVIEARRAESRAEAAAVLARLADSDLLPVVLGEREPDQAEVTALVRRGLMWRGGSFRYTGPTEGWTPVRTDVVALYRELTTTPTTPTEDR
jgi:hypothetical protein